MVKAIENIFGGEPTLNAYDGTGQYSAFIDGVGGGVLRGSECAAVPHPGIR